MYKSLSVAAAGPFQLLLPQSSIGSSKSPPTMQRAAVPEIAVNEYGDAARGQHQVCSTSMGDFTLQTEPKTGRMQRLSEHYFWFSISTPPP